MNHVCMMFGNKKNISGWAYTFFLSAILMAITISPFIFGFMRQNETLAYSGYHVLAPGDTSVYYSYIQQAYQGHVLFRDLFTHESTEYNMVNTYWLLAGMVGKMFNVPPVWAFHISRIMTIPLLLIALYWFVCFFTREERKRKILLTFFAFSSGISGLFAPWLYKNAYELYGYYHLPMDLWTPESNIFLSMLHSGHMVMSLALIVLVFLFMLKAYQLQKFRYSALAGVCVLILLSFHPFQAPVIFGVVGAYTLVRIVRDARAAMKYLLHIFLLGIISLPMLLYYYWAMTSDLVTIQRAIQNVNLTPAWYYLIFSYGFLLFFGIFGLIRFVRDKEYNDHGKLFLFLWFFVQLFLIFSPLNFQRRMSTGLQIPMIFFAFDGMKEISGWFKTKFTFFRQSFYLRNKLLLFFFFIILFGSSNLFILSLDFYLNSTQFYLFYIPRDRYESLQWIQNNISDSDVILAHPTSSYHIPGFSGKTVYIGHQGVETLYFHQKKYLVGIFYSNNIHDEKKIQFLNDNNISYVYYSDYEKQYGDFHPDEKSYLSLVYENQSIKIYRYNSANAP